MEKKPNILWICTDQQRWDTIEALGNKNINTPNLNRLVGKGVSFTKAYSQSTICTPSRASFMTGRYPASHHVHRNGAESFPENEVLVSKMLADAGYHCGLIGKQHLSRAQGKIEDRPDDGYHEFYYSHHPYPDGPEPGDYAEWLKQEKNIDIKELYKEQKTYGKGVPEKFHQTTWAAARASDFIERNQGQNWLLNINLFDPHPPFDPPPEILEHYNSEEIPLPLFKESDLYKQNKFKEIDQQVKTAQNIIKLDQTTGKFEQKSSSGPSHSSAPTRYNPGQVKACYFASIELIDKKIGLIIDKLEELNLFEDTIIIFMSDHGELLGDHGLLYKGCRFYEGLVHVPLIISAPGRFKEDIKSKALVELVDIAPTLLEACDLDIPYYIQGRSLFDILKGKSDPHVHKKRVISEYNDALNMEDSTHGFMYFDGRYKISVYQGHEIGEIYDLKEDPGEFNNLWGKSEYSELQQNLLKKLVDALLETGSAGIKRSGDY